MKRKKIKILLFIIILLLLFSSLSFFQRKNERSNKHQDNLKETQTAEYFKHISNPITIDNLKRDSIFFLTEEEIQSTYKEDKNRKPINIICNSLENLNCNLEGFNFYDKNLRNNNEKQTINRVYALDNESIHTIETTKGKKLITIATTPTEISEKSLLIIWNIKEDGYISVQQTFFINLRSIILDVRNTEKYVYITTRTRAGDVGYSWNRISVLKFDESFTKEYIIDFEVESEFNGDTKECLESSELEYSWDEDKNLIIKKHYLVTPDPDICNIHLNKEDEKYIYIYK